jgi:hypothetical protein
MQQVFNTQDVNLIHFGPKGFNYVAKGIHTEAIQVTAENIGRLALEFEVELRWTNEGAPFFWILAERGTDQTPEPPSRLVFYVGDWITPLWGEIHRYDDYTFSMTFTANLSEPPLVPATYPDGSFEPASGHVEGPNGTGIMPPVKA